MKIILCGYNWAGCKALQLLLDGNHEVFVFTHTSPDYVHDLKTFCEKKKVPYSLQKITAGNLPFVPDLIASIYYRYIIQDEVIDLVKGKIFNLHPSLLPDYKGCSSLTWAMINGEKFAGYTYHYISNRVDSGNIILQERIAIEDFDTQQSLYFKVMFAALNDFEKAMKHVVSNDPGTVQVNSQRDRYYKRGCPYDGVLDESWPEEKAERFIRAMIYPPLPAARFKDMEIYTMDQYQNLRK